MQVQKATIDQPAYNQHGALLIKTTLVGTGVSYYVADSAGRVDDLSKSFTDLAEAAAYYRHIAYAAEQGKRTYQIVWEVQALQEAQNAATGRTPDEVAAAINADGAAYVATETAVHNQVVQMVAEAAPDRQGWHRERQQSRAAITSQAMDRIITDAARNNGRIVRSREATSTQLVALNKRGLVELVYGKRGNTRVIVGARLTAKGFKHAAVDKAVAA